MIQTTRTGFFIFLLAAFSSHAHQLTAFIAGGPNFSTLKNEKLVQINNFVTNSYQSTVKTDWEGFIGGGLEHSFEKKWWHSNISLGIAGYGFNLGQVQGIEYPFINAGIFDTLNYSFKVKSFALLVESRLAYQQYAWQPFIIVGIGPAWNKAQNYQEAPTNPSLSAAPVSPVFRNNTKQAFAYELGLGIQHQLWEDKINHCRYLASLGYRYFNLGESKLGTFPAQTSPARLQINNLYTQGIVFSLSASFS